MALVRQNRSNIRLFLATAIVAAAALIPSLSEAQDRVVPDTYLATTVNMTPTDVELKADILRWSTDEERAAVVAVLDSEEDPAAALRSLPSMGVVWRSNSAVGHSVKYAHRVQSDDGKTHVTLLTDRAIGSTSFEPWTADDPAADAPLDYSVIELTIGDGSAGIGTMSLAAAISIDADTNTISLDSGDSSPILTNVTLAPKPYWARSQ